MCETNKCNCKGNQTPPESQLTARTGVAMIEDANPFLDGKYGQG